MASQDLVVFQLALLLALAGAQQCGTDPQAPICDNSTELCCKDSPDCSGACTECCVKQNTYCVPPRGGYATSTCCGLYTVGCTVGSVGCCDPARVWQYIGGSQPKQLGIRKPHSWHMPSTDTLEHENLDSTRMFSQGAPSSSTAFALFTDTVRSGLSCYEIVPATGKVTAKRKVSGPAAKYLALFFGESTRLLPFDAESKKFIWADIDRVQDKLIVYTIDATTGISTASAVEGCGTEYPVGLSWDSVQSSLIISSQTADTAHFCSVKPGESTARDLGSVLRGSDENSASYYAAYHTFAHNGTVVRVGSKTVSVGGSPGIGTTTPGSGTTWADQWVVPGHGPAASAVRHQDGFLLSLSPRKADGSLDIVKVDQAKVEVVGNLTNAHHPSMPVGGGILGYVGDATHKSVYAALTVAKKSSPVLPTVKDRWQLHFLDTATGKVVDSTLQPQPSLLGAETVALSGFGLVAS